MPAHKHTAVSTSASISGTFGCYAWAFDYVSGCFTAQKMTASPNGGGGNSNNNKITLKSTQNHSVTLNNTGGNKGHNNIPPFLVCYMWKRVA